MCVYKSIPVFQFILPLLPHFLGVHPSAFAFLEFFSPNVSAMHLVESPDSKPKRYCSYHLCCISEKLRHKKFKEFKASHSVVSDSATPWTAALQASLSITISRSLLKLSLAVVRLLVRRGDECKLNRPDCKAQAGSHHMKVPYISKAMTRNTIRCCISRWRRCFSVYAFFFLFFRLSLMLSYYLYNHSMNRYL